VFIKLPSGKTIPSDVEGLDITVDFLKKKIVEREHINSPFKLVFKGKPLNEENTLGSCGISKEATIHLVNMKPKLEVKESKSKKLESNSSLESDENEDLKTKETSVSTINTYNYDNLDLTDELKAEFLASFATGAESSNVEIVFSFDTTGSMSSCLVEVRKKVSETCSRLMKDIPNIRIGIIAHGDYCDDNHYQTISILNFCEKNEVDKIVNFVNNAKPTSGGDSPEAYELALQVARKNFKWTPGYSKALVVIGDEVPHPPSYTTEKINWKDEVSLLSEMGVKIYGIRALNCSHAIPFYEEISERTGTVSINFKNFKLIVDMFLAICYREASSDKLQEFAEEIKKEGKMTEELGTILQTLSQPNPEKKTREASESKHKCIESWYKIEEDNGVPQYTKNKITKRWVPYKNSLWKFF